METKTLKTKQLEEAVLAKLKERIQGAKKGKVDLVKLKKQLITAISANNEKKTIKLLGDIEKHVSNKDLVNIMKEVKDAIEKNKVVFPKFIEVLQSAKPKWYKDPATEVGIKGPVEAKIKDVVEIKGTVKTEQDAGYWTAFGAVLGVAMSGLFEFLNKFGQKVFRVMPAKEHYTTPQLMVLADPKTGRPVSLKDIGQGNNVTVVNPGGGRGGSSSSTTVPKYLVLLDEVSATLSYMGEAVPGTATSAPSWRIRKIDTSAGVAIEWAESSTAFSYTWDNRASYTYA